MKITSRHLRQIIREELRRNLNESIPESMLDLPPGVTKSEYMAYSPGKEGSSTFMDSNGITWEFTMTPRWSKIMSTASSFDSINRFLGTDFQITVKSVRPGIDLPPYDVFEDIEPGDRLFEPLKGPQHDDVSKVLKDLEVELRQRGNTRTADSIKFIIAHI